MFRSTLAVLALSVSALHTAPVSAAPISSLEECYQAVITWCVETFPDHADQCGQSSGLDDCDEEFGNASASGMTLNRVGPAISARSFARLMAGVDQRAAPARMTILR